MEVIELFFELYRRTNVSVTLILNLLGFQISIRESKSDDDRSASLHQLKNRFDEKKHEILARKSECTAMAGDSEQFARKVKDIETW